MTASERKAVLTLVGTAQSTVNSLEYYARDYQSKEILSIAKNLQESIETFRILTKKKTKK